MQHIIRHLFRVDTLEEVSRERLEELVGSYPSYGIGRYLLSRKLQTENAGQFAEETQKTNLYFTNPFWLQWLLQAPSAPAVTKSPVGEQPVLEEQTYFADIPVFDEQVPNIGNPVIDEQTSTIEHPVIEEEAFAAGQPAASEPMTVTGHSLAEHNTSAADQPVTHEQAFSTEQPDTAELPAAASGPVIVEEPGAAEELPQGPLSAAESLLQSLTEARELRQSLVQMNEVNADEPIHDEQSIGQPSASHVINESPATAHGEPPVMDLAASWPSEQFIPEEEPPADFEELAPDYEPADFEKAKEAIAAKVAAQAANPGTLPGQETTARPAAAGTFPEQEPAPLTASADTDSGTASTPAGPATGPDTQTPSPIVSQLMPLAEPIVLFEPYHTIDYFASVGIKFVQEENPQDKLGKQLKSFTEWLKVMRKLPQKNQEIVPDVAAEHQIQAIAAHSIKGKEVLTETMAEVLVKQGMREKAMEVYHKLSLLNPEKSAYFATKIEQLKID